MGKMDLEFYNVIDIATELGNDARNALPFFYAFSSCDTVSAKASAKFGMYGRQTGDGETSLLFLLILGICPKLNAYQIDILEYFLKKLHKKD